MQKMVCVTSEPFCEAGQTHTGDIYIHSYLGKCMQEINVNILCVLCVCLFLYCFAKYYAVSLGNDIILSQEDSEEEAEVS